MSAWAESRVVTATAWTTLRQNRYLLAFPVVGFLASLVPLAVCWIPAILLIADNKNWVGAVLVVVGVFATQCVVAFSSGALVAAVDEELAGRGSSLGAGFAAAFARAGALLQWAVISTVVSLLVSALRGNGNGIGGLLQSLAAGLVSAAWQVVTFFVVPVIMLERAGAVAAIKGSVAMVRQKWGTQVLGGLRIGGLVLLVAMLPALAMMVGGVVLTGLTSPALGVPLLVFGVLVFAAAALVANAMKAVFSVALYRYVGDGEVLGGFTTAQLDAAARTR